MKTGPLHLVSIRQKTTDSDHYVAANVNNIITKKTGARTPKPAASVRVTIALTSAHLILLNARPAKETTPSLTATARNGTKRGR